MLEISEKKFLCRPEKNAFALDGESVMTGFRAGLCQISRKFYFEANYSLGASWQVHWKKTNFLLIIHNDVTCWNTGNWNIDLKGGCYQVFAEVSTMVANQLSQWLFEGHPRCVSPRGGRIQSFHWNVFKGLDKYATDASHVSDEMWWQECLLGFDLYRPIVPLACAASTRSMQIGCHTSCSMNWKQKNLVVQQSQRLLSGNTLSTK